MRAVRAATDALLAEAGVPPGIKEVAARCGFSVAHTAHLLRAMRGGESKTPLPPLHAPGSSPGAAANDPLDEEEVDHGEWEAEQSAVDELELHLERCAPTPLPAGSAALACAGCPASWEQPCRANASSRGPDALPCPPVTPAPAAG